jgi:hypothetical protein
MVGLLSITSVSVADHRVTSMGARSCSEWSKDRKHHDWDTLNDETWVVGFLSGYVAHSGRDILHEVKPDSIFGLVDVYCLSNPKASLYDAVNQAAINRDQHLTRR